MKVYQSRVEMLSMVPRGSDCCEVGVFRLEFAKEIARVVEPRSFLLIDTFHDCVVSGDKDGGNVAAYSGALLRAAAEAWCDESPGRRLVVGPSVDGLRLQPDASLDFVYVDADHSYECCRSDLREAWRVVRPGGLIAGHDYTIHWPRCADASHYATMGVQRAVNEMCEAHGVDIEAVALDGYTSYMVRKPQ